MDAFESVDYDHRRLRGYGHKTSVVLGQNHKEAGKHLLQTLILTFPDNKIVEDVRNALRLEARGNKHNKLTPSTMQSVCVRSVVLESLGVPHEAEVSESESIQPLGESGGAKEIYWPKARVLPEEYITICGMRTWSAFTEKYCGSWQKKLLEQLAVKHGVTGLKKSDAIKEIVTKLAHKIHPSDHAFVDLLHQGTVPAADQLLLEGTVRADEEPLPEGTVPSESEGTVPAADEQKGAVESIKGKPKEKEVNQISRRKMSHPTAFCISNEDDGALNRLSDSSRTVGQVNAEGHSMGNAETKETKRKARSKNEDSRRRSSEKVPKPVGPTKTSPLTPGVVDQPGQHLEARVAVARAVEASDKKADSDYSNDTNDKDEAFPAESHVGNPDGLDVSGLLEELMLASSFAHAMMGPSARLPSPALKLLLLGTGSRQTLGAIDRGWCNSMRGLGWDGMWFKAAFAFHLRPAQSFKRAIANSQRCTVKGIVCTVTACDVTRGSQPSKVAQ
ncbi:unnamed protein product [Durusdinium trenchii]|uniref:Uncharacterized protein n=1 Tax=Durusdinium trenchii TaxID=1381693 RepID=A0ABP0KTS8_9DINO